MAGSAGPIPSIPNGTPPLPELVEIRCARRGAAGAGAGPQGTRRSGSQRMLHGRQLRTCQKGGSKVGPTKRGKGSKLMAVADRAGLPLGVRLESASPAEVKLAPDTLCEVREQVGAWPRRLVVDRAYDSDRFRTMVGLTGGAAQASAGRRARSADFMTTDGPAYAAGAAEVSAVSGLPRASVVRQADCIL